jgi:hypothetical protein
MPVRPAHDLVYADIDGRDGRDFLRRTDAEELAAVHAAIQGSVTWGEFRMRLSRARWLQVVAGLRGLGDDARVPDDGAPLAGIPGYDDGDWPSSPPPACSTGRLPRCRRSATAGSR